MTFDDICPADEVVEEEHAASKAPVAATASASVHVLAMAFFVNERVVFCRKECHVFIKVAIARSFITCE